MNAITPLTLIKGHLNLDHGDDDALLAHYTEAAEAWVSAYTGQPFAGSPLERQAVLMLVAHSYECREAVSFARAFSVPYGVEDILSPIKSRIVAHVPDVVRGEIYNHVKGRSPEAIVLRQIDGTPYDLSGTTVSMVAQNGVPTVIPASIHDAILGIVIPSGLHLDAIAAGYYAAALQVVWVNGKSTTFPEFTLRVLA